MTTPTRSALDVVRAALLAAACAVAAVATGSAQPPERVPVRVLFLGGDGRLIELSGGIPAAPGAVHERAAESTALGSGSAWGALERQPLGLGFLGVSVIDLTPALRRHFDAPSDRGVMVSALAAGAPGEGAGLAVGDIVARLDGAAVKGSDAFRSEIRARRGGDRLELEVFRSGERLELVAEVAERERPLIRLLPTLVAPRQLELRVDRLDRSGEHVEIRVEELVEQVQRVLGSEAALAGPVRAVRGADRESIDRRMREVERELAELERRLRAADSQPR
jgi:hypothetical protein